MGGPVIFLVGGLLAWLAVDAIAKRWPAIYLVAAGLSLVAAARDVLVGRWWWVALDLVCAFGWLVAWHCHGDDDDGWDEEFPEWDPDPDPAESVPS